MNEREGSRCAWCGTTPGAGLAGRDRAGVEPSRARGDPPRRCSATRARGPCRSPRSTGRQPASLPARCPCRRLSTAATLPSEDLMALSYADRSFDLVVMAEPLEHVPDVERALSEIRAFSPGAAHVFTVPVVADRPARRRAGLDANGAIVPRRPAITARRRPTAATSRLPRVRVRRGPLPRRRLRPFRARDGRNPARSSPTAPRPERCALPSARTSSPPWPTRNKPSSSSIRALSGAFRGRPVLGSARWTSTARCASSFATATTPAWISAARPGVDLACQGTCSSCRPATSTP